MQALAADAASDDAPDRHISRGLMDDNNRPRGADLVAVMRREPLHRNQIVDVAADWARRRKSNQKVAAAGLSRLQLDCKGTWLPTKTGDTGGSIFVWLGAAG